MSIIPEQYRLVAYIFPEEDSWGLSQVDEHDFPRIASENQKDHPRYAIALSTVWHPIDHPEGWMVYEEKAPFPSRGDENDFKLYMDCLNHALSLPVMHREDFSLIIE